MHLSGHTRRSQWAALIVGVAVGCGGPSRPAEGALQIAVARLAAVEIGGGQGVWGAATIRPEIAIWEPGVQGGEPAALLFGGLVVAEQDSGRSFVFDGPEDDIDFERFAELVSDGANSKLCYYTNVDVGPLSHCATERELFIPLQGLEPGEGFAGLEIAKFVLSIGRVRIESPGRDPNGDGNWTDFAIEFDVVVYAVAA